MFSLQASEFTKKFKLLIDLLDYVKDQEKFLDCYITYNGKNNGVKVRSLI